MGQMFGEGRSPARRETRAQSSAQGLHHPGDQRTNTSVEKFKSPRRSSESEVRRNYRIFKRVLSGLFAGKGLVPQAAPPAQPGGATFQDSSNELSVAVGKTVLVDCVAADNQSCNRTWRCGPGFRDQPQRDHVNGKNPGENSLIIWTTGAAGNSSM